MISDNLQKSASTVIPIETVDELEQQVRIRYVESFI